MAGNSVSTSQSTSTSVPVIPNYPQSPFLQAIAEYAGQVGSQVYAWAQQQFANNTKITDQNINNYLTTSANALGQAQRDTSRYETKFQPEENQLLADANSYASPNRVKMEMGQAISGQAQAANASLHNAERDLQSYGIDPSSGRYAALDKAAAVQSAANEAGAAQQARYNTEATGRALRSEAIQVGERYPGQITNSLNTALQGYAGAENSQLANSSAGVALQGATDPYLNTASSLKYPPIGNATNSQSTGNTSSTSTDPSKSDNNKQQGNSDGNTPYNPNGVTNYGGGSGGGGSSGGNEISAGDPLGDSSGTSGGSDVWGSGSGTDYSGLGSTDWTGGGGLADYSGDYSGATMPSGDYGNSYAPSDGSVFDTGSGVDYSGGGGDYAEGGDIDDGTEAIPTDGGAIPKSASPSGGRQVDDVRAQSPRGTINVNVHEFVVPQDVALWKGQEFFQKLIAQSRMARTTAPARPRMTHG